MPMIIGIPEHDATRDTAGTGGIRAIARKRSGHADEGWIYTIRGVLRPPIKRRNFQGKSRYFQVGEIKALQGHWELAHLWPPRFGDEAAAGIMAAPAEMNQAFQNHGIEPWLQQLRKGTGGLVEITARAACWDAGWLRKVCGFDDSIGRTEVMKWVEYSVSDCPTGTQSPIGGPLLGTSVKMQLEPPRPGVMPKVVHIEGGTLLNWM